MAISRVQAFSRSRQLYTIPFTASLEHCQEKHQRIWQFVTSWNLVWEFKTSKGQWLQADSCAAGREGWSRCWPPSCTCLTCPPRPPGMEKCIVKLDLCQLNVQSFKTFLGKEAMWKCTDPMQHCLVVHRDLEHQPIFSAQRLQDISSSWNQTVHSHTISFL